LLALGQAAVGHLADRPDGGDLFPVSKTDQPDVPAPARHGQPIAGEHAAPLAHLLVESGERRLVFVQRRQLLLGAEIGAARVAVLFEPVGVDEARDVVAGVGGQRVEEALLA
jgi:hypothetical protein